MKFLMYYDRTEPQEFGVCRKCGLIFWIHYIEMFDTVSYFEITLEDMKENEWFYPPHNFTSEEFICEHCQKVKDDVSN